MVILLRLKKRENPKGKGESDLKASNHHAWSCENLNFGFPAQTVQKWKAIAFSLNFFEMLLDFSHKHVI